MKKKLLSLGVGRSSGAEGASSARSVPTKDQVEKTLKRDGFACRFCGFVSRKFQRAVFDPQDASSSEEGLVTVCSFCEMCLVLDRAGLTGGGTLIWLPELSQEELNHVVRALYVARGTEGSLAKAAAHTLDVLMTRRSEAKKRLGTDDPLLLATAFLENLDEKTYGARKGKLEGLRLLPADRYLVRHGGGDVNIFPQMLKYWTSSAGPFGKLPVAEWEKMFEDVAGKAAAHG